MKPTTSIDKQIQTILQDWLDNALSTSSMGVTVDDERTDLERQLAYDAYLKDAKAKISGLVNEAKVVEYEKGIQDGLIEYEDKLLYHFAYSGRKTFKYSDLKPVGRRFKELTHE